MNRFFQNKFLISFLVFTIAVLGFSAKEAEAKGVASVFTKVLIAVVVIAAVVVTAGGALGLSAPLINAAWIVGGAATGITTISQVACMAGSDNVGFTGCGGDNGGGGDGGGDGAGSGGPSGASVSSGNKPLNCWKITSTMYIPQLNGSGYNNQ